MGRRSDRLDLEADVDRWGRVSEGADRDQIDTALGIAADVGKSDAPGGLNKWSAGPGGTGMANQCDRLTDDVG